MPDDDVDDTAESITTPLNVELNPQFSVTDDDQDDGTDAPEPPSFDGRSSKPDTGFSSGH